ncbi:formin-like protein 5 [Typha latifolia]|uniref:formin-like protein 5 n=1 Tax=Typha latifolia TaxID=4733 RepID=UPI003C2E5D1F
MSILRRFFSRKPSDELVEISERVYVFDSCLSTESLGEDYDRDYYGGIVEKLQDHFPSGSIKVVNFREGNKKSKISDILSEYDLTVKDYPYQYGGCPLLPLATIHHFLVSSESWLSSEGQHNVLLMHFERGGWPVLAFVLAGLLLFRKQFTGEQRTLEMVYRQASTELLQLSCPLNPKPSHVRYLHYISQRGNGSEWRTQDAPFTLECLTLGSLPNFDGEGGCSPLVRIYGQDPLIPADRGPKLLFETPSSKKHLRRYRKTESTSLKLSTCCRVQGDVVVECIHVDEDLKSKEIMFRVMFNTAFIRSNVFLLNRDEIDVAWNAKHKFPMEFRAEVQFSNLSAFETDATTKEIADDRDDIEDASTDEADEFYEAEEVFINVDPQDGKKDSDDVFRVKTLRGDANPGSGSSMAVKQRSSLETSNAEEHLKIVATKNLSSKCDARPKSFSPNITHQSESRSDAGYARITGKSIKVDETSPMFQRSTREIDMTGKPNTIAGTRVIATSGAEEESTSERHSHKDAIKGITRKAPNAVAELVHKLEVPNQAGELSSRPEYNDSEYDRLKNIPINRNKGPNLMTMSDESQGKSEYKAEPSLQGKIGISGVKDQMKISKLHSGDVNTTNDKALEVTNFNMALNSTIDEDKSTAEICNSKNSIQSEDKLESEGGDSKVLSRSQKKDSNSGVTDVETGVKFKQEVNDSKRDAEIGKDARRQTPEESMPPIAQSDQTISRQKIGQQEKTKLATKPKPTTRWMSPNKGPGATSSVHGSSQLPTRHVNSPQEGVVSSLPAAASATSAGPRGRGPPPPPPPGASRPGPPPPPPRAPGAPPPPPGGPLDSRSNSRGRGSRSPLRPGSIALAPRKVKLKSLHWVKIARAVQGTLWAELQKSDDAESPSEFDVSELEKFFSAVVSDSKSERRQKSLGSNQEVHLIDLKRANNTQIMLNKVKMPTSDLMSAALALDDSILDIDQVENLIKFCPTKEEMELLKRYTGEVAKLGKCEKFFLELMKVPRVESKLRAFSFKIQFASQVADLRGNLNSVDSACEQIRNSVKLKELMKKVLHLGNTLNQGTAKGSAIGFRLDSLLKLTDTRATDNKMTLMHYLCKVVASKSPLLLDFHEDLISLEAASKIQLKSLAEEMQAIGKGLKTVVLELNASENDGPVSKVFCKKLNEFIAVAEDEVQFLSSLYSAVGRHADALVLYFGEDPARCPFEQVISTLQDFVLMFRRAHKENCKQAELEKRRSQKEAERAMLNVSSPTSKYDQSPANLSQQLQQALERTSSTTGREKTNTL